MASVRYLHTMRFLKEILAFLSHFPQLIDAFQRMKAMAQGNLVSACNKIREIDALGPRPFHVCLQTCYAESVVYPLKKLSQEIDNNKNQFS